MKSKAMFISRMAAVSSAAILIAVPTFGYLEPAQAQDKANVSHGPVDVASVNIAERYPPESIQSVETADKALEEAQKERARAEVKFAADEQACYPKFFVTSCIDAAKEERRRTLALVQQVEVEANAFKRRARVAERDRALAEKAPQAVPIIKPPKEAKTGEPEVSRSVPANTQNAERSGEASRTGQAGDSKDRVAEHEAKLERLQEKEAADAQKRAENVAAYERKARKAEERQREVAARKAEKERKRAEKNSRPATP